MNLIQKVETLYTNNTIRTYLITFSLVFLAYFSKLSYSNYPPDDYMRLFQTEDWFFQADRGRWVTSILNHFIFKEGNFILPYFNTLLSLFFLSLSGLIISKIWGIKNQFIIGTIIIITSISPFWALNLFYNSNVTVSIGFLLATLAIYILKHQKSYRFLGFLLLILSSGIYQTITQSTALIIIGWFLLNLIDTENIKKIKELVFSCSKLLAYVILAYIISHFISELIIKFNQIDLLFSPYKVATREVSVIKILKKTYSIFTSPSSFLHYFTLKSITATILTFAVIFLGIYSYTISLIKEKKIKIILFIFSLVLIIFILHFPRFLSVSMPIRSSFHFSILLSLLFVFTFLQKKVFIKNISFLILSFLMLFYIQYITSFYDVINRQTLASINRANEIVNRIMLDDKNDFNEKNIPNFLIIGEKNFPVASNFSKNKKKFSASYLTQNYTPTYYTIDPFNFSWSKYKIFENFTNFSYNFAPSNKEELIKKIRNLDTINEYPYKNSILFIDDTIVLILDKNEIN